MICSRTVSSNLKTVVRIPAKISINEIKFWPMIDVINSEFFNKFISSLINAQIILVPINDILSEIVFYESTVLSFSLSVFS